jgi:BMFP domain-containing protein YqiC
MESVEDLRAKIASLEARLASYESANEERSQRQKIASMSDEVVDSNPYR